MGCGVGKQEHQDWRLEAPPCRVYAIKLLARKKGIVASEISHQRGIVVYCSEQWATSRTERWCPYQKLAWAMAGILRGIHAPWALRYMMKQLCPGWWADEGGCWVFLKPVRGRRHTVVGIEHPGPGVLMCSQQNHKTHSATLRALKEALKNL